MSYDLRLVSEGDDLLDAMEQMRSRGVRRLPVVDDDGALAGILAVDDLIELAAEQLTDLVALIARERQREERLRH
jgi:CBS domain-containing protein